MHWERSCVSQSISYFSMLEIQPIGSMNPGWLVANNTSGASLPKIGHDSRHKERPNNGQGEDHKRKPKHIIANARPKGVVGERTSYQQVVGLAFPGEANNDIVYTVGSACPLLSDVQLWGRRHLLLVSTCRCAVPTHHQLSVTTRCSILKSGIERCLF
jgi:hypothetical protein